MSVTIRQITNVIIFVPTRMALTSAHVARVMSWIKQTTVHASVRIPILLRLNTYVRSYLLLLY